MENKNRKKAVADTAGEVKAVGRPRKETTVGDLIIKLKEVKVLAGQIVQQNPNRRFRMMGITRQIDRWLNITLKRIEDDPVEN